MHVAQAIRKYLAWCPNADARSLRTAARGTAALPVTVNPAQPDGGAGGAGSIGRGLMLTTGSIRLLFRNRQLLWFPLLTGLVMISSLVATLYLQFISGTALFLGTDLATAAGSVVIRHGSLPWVALTFITGLFSTLLTYYILAALIVCVSGISSGRTATVTNGLVQARHYLYPLFCWAAVWALVGTLVSFFMTPPAMTSAPGNLGMIYGIIAVTACINILTLFVIPLLVLAGVGLATAVPGSLSLLRRVWAETIVCFILYVLILVIVVVTSLIPLVVVGFSSGSALAAGAVVGASMLVMLLLIFISSTVMGITITGLYFYGKTGTLPPVFEGKQTGSEYA